MENEKIIEAIIDKITAGYDNYEIERFLKQQEINLDEFDRLIEEAENKILVDKLETYPKQNRLAFNVSLSLLGMFFLLFCFIMPSLNITNGIIPISIVGSICISLSGFYAILYYKSWEKSFIERLGKPKLDLQTYLLVSSLPTVLFYFLISWSFLEGPAHNLYKVDITIKAIKAIFS